MAFAPWTFTVSNLAGSRIGEVLDAPERQVVRALSGPSVASFKVPVTTPLLTDLLTGDLNLQCYRANALMFHGPIITTELAVEDETATPLIACGAADPSFRFEKRVAGQTPSGTLFNGVDRLTAAESLIGTTNSASETGVRTLGQTCGSTSVYIAGPYKKLSECIADLGNTLSGFDWRIDPTEYAAGKIGDFKAAAVLGVTQAGAVFEYEGRGNMRVPNFQRGIVDLANKVYSIPDDGPTSSLSIRQAQDTASITARGLYEEVIDTSNITNATLRDAVLNDHILFRKNPRQVLTFSPDFSGGDGRVPEYGTDYVVGDTVRARVLYNNASLVDGFVRLYRMQFDIDENSRETLTPTVVNET